MCIRDRSTLVSPLWGHIWQKPIRTINSQMTILMTYRTFLTFWTYLSFLTSLWAVLHNMSLCFTTNTFIFSEHNSHLPCVRVFRKTGIVVLIYNPAPYGRVSYNNYIFCLLYTSPSPRDS